MPFEPVHDPLKVNAAQRADLLRRAALAWLKSGGDEIPNPRSGVQVRRGLVYVVLRGAHGVLAVFRARRDNGTLRRMKRWPPSLDNLKPTKRAEGERRCGPMHGRRLDETSSP